MIENKEIFEKLGELREKMGEMKAEIQSLKENDKNLKTELENQKRDFNTLLEKLQLTVESTNKMISELKDDKSKVIGFYKGLSIIFTIITGAILIAKNLKDFL